MKTFHVKPDELNRDWYEVDATGKTVGRLATQIAQVLIGKHKPIFSKHVDVGDFVVVTNADKVSFTGNKWSQKNYYRHSGYPGGLKVTNAETMLERHPEHILKAAVNGMLPKNRLRDRRLKRLKLYAAESHPHGAQQPKPFPEFK
ncbi:MAG: 50S ribosomal protein L13 [Candidatus Eremiobacteraeota bacterium]|nr:50S ribosomal protein L13 [Candidatus Eremiobacteraeota bacterium]